MRRLLATLLLCGMGFGADQAKPAPAPITLMPASSKLLEIPGFSFSGNAQCDATGNLYFHTGFDPNDSIVLKVRTDGSNSIYRLVGTDAADTYFTAFRVDPDGRLWLLDGGREKHEGIYIFQFGDDADRSTRTRLDAPEGLNVQNFLVLRNDHILLHGYFDEKATPKKRGRSYLAEFEPSGKLVRESLEKTGDDVLKDLASRSPDAAAAQGDNGLIYLLEADEISVISSSFQVIRSIKLKPPDSDYRAHNLYLAMGRLLIGFNKPSEQRPFIVARYALLDASTGEQLRLFQPGPETGNNLVCFSNEGFTFYRVEHGRVKLVTATAN